MVARKASILDPNIKYKKKQKTSRAQELLPETAYFILTTEGSFNFKWSLRKSTSAPNRFPILVFQTPTLLLSSWFYSLHLYQMRHYHSKQHAPVDYPELYINLRYQNQQEKRFTRFNLMSRCWNCHNDKIESLCISYFFFFFLDCLLFEVLIRGPCFVSAVITDACRSTLLCVSTSFWFALWASRK